MKFIVLHEQHCQSV